jgi:hypothetical protein
MICYSRVLYHGHTGVWQDMQGHVNVGELAGLCHSNTPFCGAGPWGAKQGPENAMQPAGHLCLFRLGAVLRRCRFL